MTPLNTIIEEEKEAQKTNEEIVEEFRKKFPQFRGVGAPYPMFDETPVYTHVIQFIEYALTLKDEAHKKEMEEVVKVGVDLTMNAMIKNSSGFDTINGRRIWHVDLDALQDSLTPTKEVTEELKVLESLTKE